jgi:hypothetical protein
LFILKIFCQFNNNSIIYTQKKSLLIIKKNNYIYHKINTEVYKYVVSDEADNADAVDDCFFKFLVLSYSSNPSRTEA